MGADGKMTVVTEGGVLVFDGEVIEAFGFSYFERGALRVHVAKLEQIELDEGGRFRKPLVSFHSGLVAAPLRASFRPEEADQIKAFVEAVRAAAPNLKS